MSETTAAHADRPQLGPAGQLGDPPLTARQGGAALAAGVVTAIAIVDHEPGLGIGLAWLTIAVAVLASRPLGTWSGAWRRAMATTAAAAAALPVLSDATWLVVPVLLAAVAAAVLGVAGGGTWFGLLRPVRRTVPLGLRSTVVLARSLRHVVPSDVRQHPALRTTLLTVLLLGVFGALFASADLVFGRFVGRYLAVDLDLDLLPAYVVVGVTVAVGTATMIRHHAREGDDQPLPAPARRLSGVEWQVPLAALVVLFAGFVALQFGLLFGGHERVLVTGGLTYAEYARSGFAQLVVVAALTLLVVAGATRYADVPTERDRRLRDGLLAGLCVLTLVVLVSAAHRLGLYEDAYGFTRLRLAARGAIVWFGVVFVLLLVAGAARRTHLLPRVVALGTAVALVAVGLVQPDAHVARWNVDRYEAGGDIDIRYLDWLSADAVPELLRLPEQLRGCALESLAWRLDRDRDLGWGSWNRSRQRAAALLDEPDAVPACDWTRMPG